MLTALERNLLVANRISMILGILSIVLLVILVVAFGTNVNTPLILGLAIFFFLIIYLNKHGYVNSGRILLCVVPGMFTLTAALLAKIHDGTFTDILYYDSRFFLILFAIVPCLVFETSERLRLYGCLSLLLLTLLMFDPVHELFGVGYYQKGFQGTSYYFINYVSALSFFGIAAGAISLKKVVENTERVNEIYKADLRKTNQKLYEALNDLESQNEEITAQSEELFASQELLQAANNVIESQKKELQEEVLKVTSELREANEELVKHNNELQQFSYSLSHNLRAPIARLLGLVNLARLLEKFQKDEESSTIIRHIESSSNELDVVTRDLSAIVDIRNTIYQIRQHIDFAAEWTEIRRLLNVTPEMERENFSIDFSEAPAMFSVRPMVHSILLNLVSNAIKYRSLAKPLRVSITTKSSSIYTIIEVSDNGLGIDLDLFSKDIFKMYKRFHHHQEGKGLGLYLIKSQAESLNGYVEISSETDIGTTFKVYIKNPTSDTGAVH
jgi:signal transduction histidine kinase